MRHTSYIVLLAAIVLSSCQFRKDEIVDFTDIAGAKDLKFQVISQHETDLEEGLPYNCFLPDGTPVCEYTGENNQPADGKNYMPQTSSVTASRTK